jgi:preprotein translocase subunit SecG
MNLLIGFFTAVLILVSLFMVLIILMQRPRSDSGLGAALGGGGAADAAFGAETGNILSRSTIYCAIFFFVVTFGLYLGNMYTNHRAALDGRSLPQMRAVGDIDPLGAPDMEERPVDLNSEVTPPTEESTSAEPSPLD